MSSSRKKGPYKVLCGLCPDQQCKAKLFFPAHDLSIECSSCGQRHAQSALTDIAEVTNPQVALHNILKNILLGKTTPKKGTDSVKVLGVSNYQCKMISPFLTSYGMDKHTKQARLLKEMHQGPTFDCAVLGDRVFSIDPEHINIVGYGRDKTGSMNYLKDTLNAMKKFNDDEERLLPIHADGDGHCLVHALSRSLIGRELFWHALRENLSRHFLNNLDKYKLLFQDFIDESEWKDIVAECAPDFTPQAEEAMGLRNIHIFGLANVLKRPIVLLDSLSGLQSSGDYTGIFLPGLLEPSQCRGKDGSLNKPLCVAWSSSAHNHYIALVAVKGRAFPRLPYWMVPKAWGIPNDKVSQYIDVGKDGTITFGGNKCLQDQYILNLVKAMEEVFQKSHNVSTSLVADVHQYVFKSTGIVGVLPEIVIETTQKALQEQRLYRCLTCDAVTEWTILPDLLRRGGGYYQLAVNTHGTLSKDKHYSFPMQGLICSYNPDTDTLVPEMSKSCMAQCQWCQGLQMREVKPDGTPQYKNGDKTKNKVAHSKCGCGFKHYWDGKEYDNLPEILPVTLEWNGAVVGEKVTWFQYESDTSLNSNVYEVANKLVQKHFPGEFGSERLAQKVVDTILRQTAKKGSPPEEAAASGDDPLKQETVPTKIILTGQQSKSIHKEELTMSETEKKLRSSIESKASIQQKRKTDELGKSVPQATKSATALHKQQKTVSSPPRPSTASKPQSMDTAPPPSPSSASSSKKPGTDSGGMGGSSAGGSKGKKVRVTTSDGRQTQLTLLEDITYSELQKRLQTEFSIPPERQRIRMGFPPKALEAPHDGEAETPLNIAHGERLMVEVLPDTSQQANRPVVENPWPAKEEKRTSWSSFDATTREQSAQEMLSGLQELHDSTDTIDMSIATLVMMAKLQGKDLWKYVQSMPHLFSVGGLFYQQVKRDLTLADGKHCTLPSIPGKVFRYNATHDRLELCLEPHGHFPVEPGIEERVMNDSLVNIAHKQGALQPRDLMTGSSGVVVNPHMKYPNHVAFSGQGHSLRSSQDDTMPKELQRNNNQKNKAARFRKLSTGSMDEAIPEEDNVMAGSREGSVEGETDGAFKRVGPGYTVLEESQHQSNSEILHTLAHCIESLVEETEQLGDIDEDDTESENIAAQNSSENSAENQPQTVAMDTDTNLCDKSAVRVKMGGTNTEKNDTVNKEQEDNNTECIVDSTITMDTTTNSAIVTINSDKVTTETIDSDKVTTETIDSDKVTTETIDSDKVTTETIDSDKVTTETISELVVTESMEGDHCVKTGQPSSAEKRTTEEETENEIPMDEGDNKTNINVDGVKVLDTDNNTDTHNMDST